MCDYSLENQSSRAAEIGDRLVTCSFPNTPTRGFSAAEEPGVAVCLLPGTELAFDRSIRSAGLWGGIANLFRSRFGTRVSVLSVARFRQIELSNPHTHHDALELADGRVIKLTALDEGQRARVVQLPVVPSAAFAHADERWSAEALETDFQAVP